MFKHVYWYILIAIIGCFSPLMSFIYKLYSDRYWLVHHNMSFFYGYSGCDVQIDKIKYNVYAMP
jgi:hypothetical protein